MKLKFLYLFLFTALSWSQNIGLSNYSSSDSIYIPLKPKILPLKDWQKFEMQKLQMEYSKAELEELNYISPLVIPRNPFELDMRGSSYYVPRMIRDELNLIMNRPRETAFVPVLTAGFIALQLAHQYLLVRNKTQITHDNLLEASEGLAIIMALWNDSPQTLTQLYEKEIYKKPMTTVEIQRTLDILIDSKLVRSKKIPEAETQYFPALTQKEMKDLIDRYVAEGDCSESDRLKLSELLSQLRRK